MGSALPHPGKYRPVLLALALVSTNEKDICLGPGCLAGRPGRLRILDNGLLRECLDSSLHLLEILTAEPIGTDSVEHPTGIRQVTGGRVLMDQGLQQSKRGSQFTPGLQAARSRNRGLLWFPGRLIVPW